MRDGNEKMSLQEATAKALYDQLDDSEEIRDVEGVVDDVLVITDPEITKDEYEEVIERAQEIVEDTPEGDIPFDDEYLGQYLQTCPICGSSFVEDHLLEPGATCPICLEQPEAFVVVGKIDSDDAIADELGIGDNIGDGVMNDEEEFVDDEEIDVEPVPNTMLNRTKEPEVREEPIEEPEEETPNRREVASKEIPAGNKLAESKVEETAVRDGADNINADARYKGEVTSLDGMLANRIADIAEEMGDDYSEWFGQDDIEYLIGTIKVSSVWQEFEEKLDDLIRDQVEDRVDWIRKDDPASKYYDGDLSEFEESKKVTETKKVTESDDYNSALYGPKYIAGVVKEVAQNTDSLNGTDKYTNIVDDENKLNLVVDSILDDDEMWNTVQETVLYYLDACAEGKLDESKKLKTEAEKDKYEFKAGYYEWQLLKNGKVLAVFNDFVDELPDKCTEANLRDFIDSYLLVPSFIDEEDENYENSQEFNKAIESADREKIMKVILDKLYYEYGELNESKKRKTEGKLVIDNGDETYTVDKEAKTYTIKTPKGEKTFTFDEMDEFVNQGKGMNRIYKPMSVLAYTDFKNGNLNKWNTKKECL